MCQNDNSHVLLMQHVAACNAANAANQAEKVELERKRPFILLRPRMFPDGDQWCALYGENIQNGVAAFGDTPAQAAINFDIAWLNGKPGPRNYSTERGWENE